MMAVAFLLILIVLVATPLFILNPHPFDVAVYGFTPRTYEKIRETRVIRVKGGFRAQFKADNQWIWRTATDTHPGHGLDERILTTRQWAEDLLLKLEERVNNYRTWRER